MALTVPFISQAGIGVAGGGNSANYVSQGMFLSPGARDLPNQLNILAGGVDKLGNTLLGISAKENQERMELELLKEMQQFESDALQYDDSYRSEHQGENALNSTKDAEAWYTQRLQSSLDRWQGNESAQLYLQRHAGGRVISGINGMRDYESQEQDKFKDSVFATETANFMQLIEDPNIGEASKKDAYDNYFPRLKNYYMSKGLDEGKATLEANKAFEDGLKGNFLNKLAIDMQAMPDAVLSSIDMALTGQVNAGPLYGDPKASRGERNNNPGNLVKTGGMRFDGQITGQDERFASFATPEHGIRALALNLKRYNDKYGLNTVAGIINRWAPSNENDTGAYVGMVSKALGVSANQPLDMNSPQVVASLTSAIIQHENGRMAYSDEQIASGVGAAFGMHQLPDAPEEIREKLTPLEMLKAREQAQVALNQQQKYQSENNIINAIEGATGLIKGLELESATALAAEYINTLNIPSKDKASAIKEFQETNKQEIIFRDNRESGTFMQFIDKSLQEGMSYSDLRNAAQQFYTDNGISQTGQTRFENWFAGGYDFISGKQIEETPKNMAVVDSIRTQINSGQLQNSPESENIIRAEGIKNQLSGAQINSLIDHMKQGGQNTQLLMLQDTASSAYKRMSGDKVMPDEFWFSLKNSFKPGETPTKETITRNVAQLLTEGTFVGPNGAKEEGLMYEIPGANRTNFLPDVYETDDEEAERIARELEAIIGRKPTEQEVNTRYLLNLGYTLDEIQTLENALATEDNGNHWTVPPDTRTINGVR